MPVWLPVAIAVATPLLTIAVMWGAMRTVVSHLSEQVDRLRDTVDEHQELFTGLREEVRVRFAQHEAAQKRRPAKRSHR